MTLEQTVLLLAILAAQEPLMTSEQLVFFAIFLGGGIGSVVGSMLSALYIKRRDRRLGEILKDKVAEANRKQEKRWREMDKHEKITECVFHWAGSSSIAPTMEEIEAYRRGAHHMLLMTNWQMPESMKLTVP